MAKFYEVSADYLLGLTENRQLDNISISDLHLSDAALSKTLTEHWEEILEKAEKFVGTSKQRLAYIFSQFLKIKPTEKNIDDMADMLDQSEILEPNTKKRRSSARKKRTKD